MNAQKYVILIAALLIISSCNKPLARFTYTKSDNKAPSRVIFENKSKKSETYFWDFGDGTTSKEESPEHKYFLSGHYTITLKAKKGNKEHMTTQNIAIDAPHNCTVEMETTAGNVTIQLYDNTPKHRDNFIKLAETGYYDGLLFHRVINGFMIQGGDPDSKDAQPGQRLGSGGPGYTVPAEINAENAHIKGALAAARQGDAVNPEKKSSGSQFYIVHGKPVSEAELAGMESRKGVTYTPEAKAAYLEQGGVPFLDQEYTVFGIVVEGLDIIDSIAKTNTDRADRPTEDVKILRVRAIK